MQHSLFIQILSVLYLAGCSSLTELTSPSRNPSSVPEASVRISDEEHLLQLVNSVRAKGCRCGGEWYPSTTPVQWDSLLAEIAELHSEDMVDRDYYSHTTPEGISSWERMWAGGYEFLKAGENIGGGYSSAESVVAGWLASPGHCRNIMNGAYTNMGVGRVNHVWTQLFALPVEYE